MKTSVIKRIFALSLLMLFLNQPIYGESNQVVLTAEMVNPFLMINQRQKTFLKIGLTGFRNVSPEKRTPVNVAIVIDQSGSMQGEKIKQAREAAQLALRLLNKDDIISVVAYSNTVSVLAPATKANEKDYISSAIKRIRAGGSTALFAGVSKGAFELRKFLNRNRVNRVILLSDGIANVGPSSPHQLGVLGASLAKEGISVTTIGLGLGYNEDLMTMLAQYSDGNHAFVENAADLVKVFDLEFGDVLSVVAQQVNVRIRCGNGIKPIRVLGREAEINGQQVTISMNQLYGEQEKYVLLEVEVPPTNNVKPLEVASVNLSYDNMQTKKHDALQTSTFVRFTRSEEKVVKSENRKVAIDAVEQMANEKNKSALKLRDQGKVKEAEQVLRSNALYLKQNASRLGSSKLRSYSDETEEDAEQLEGEEWRTTRKKMKKSQYKKEAQQSY